MRVTCLSCILTALFPFALCADTTETSVDKAGRPFVILSDAALQELHKQSASDSEPMATAWSKLKVQAAEALNQTFQPEDFRNSTQFGHASRVAASAGRDMIIVWHVTGENRLRQTAKKLMLEWVDFEPRPGENLERVVYGSVERGDGSTTAGLGLNVGVAAWYWSELYCLLWPELTEKERDRTSAWLRFLAELIEEGHRYWIDNDYYNEQDYNNHLSGHLVGLAAVGYALQDPKLIAYTYESPKNPRDYREMLHGTILMPSKGRGQFWRSDPSKTTQPGEIYDRYRVLTKRGGKGHGLAYAMMHLRMLIILAEMAHAHGTDYYSHAGPNGENLLLPLEHYSSFYIARSPAVKGSYHAGDRLFMHNLPVFTIGASRYPDSKPIRDVLAANADIILPSDELGYSVHLIYPSKPPKTTP